MINQVLLVITLLYIASYNATEIHTLWCVLRTFKSPVVQGRSAIAIYNYDVIFRFSEKNISSSYFSAGNAACL